MRLINATPQHTTVFWVTSRPRRGDWRATIIVKAGFRLVAGGIAVPDEAAPVASGDDPAGPEAPPRYASDFVPFKPNADFLVAGTAHAPGGKPVERCRISVSIGERRKSLVAIGDRAWSIGPLGATPGAPVPFVTLPTGYDRAFGGAGSRRNPLGCGTDIRSPRGLPNIEHPDQLITQSINNPEPAGFGPLPVTWQPRIGKAGSFHTAWLKQRWPWFPTDFDWSFFNAAPADQQFPYFRGDETMAFDNLHPGHAVYETGLPGQRARVFVERTAPDGESFAEVPVKLDTVWVDVAAERLLMLWRGVTAVGSPRMRDVAAICATLEPLDAPAEPDVHRQRFAALREAAEAGGAETAAQAAAAETLRTTVQAQADEARAMVAGLRRTAGGLMQSLGLDRLRDRARTSPDDPMAALEKAVASLKQSDPAKGRQLEDRLAALDRRLGEVMAQSGGGVPWTRERVVEALARGESLAAADLDGLDLGGLDFTGADLRDATFRKAALAGARLDRGRLAGADLSGSDLTAASFVKADLERADFSQSVVVDAVFTGARIEAAIFAGLDLSGADFSSTVGQAPDFTSAVLDGAYFGRANLPSAKFTGIRASGADFSHGILPSADFSAAKAPGIIMDGADLTNLRAGRGADFTDGHFARSRAARSVWQQAVLDGADFSRAVLSEAQMPEASLRNANFDRAQLEVVSFADAILVGARLSNASLLRASFERADLTDARVNGSVLYGAGLLDATLDNCTFDGSFVVQTELAR